MALDGEMITISAGVNYTMGDVARGDDAGASAAPTINAAVGAAAAVATINRRHWLRLMVSLHWSHPWGQLQSARKEMKR